MITETTQNYVQHSDDLGRDISNVVLEWQRRNPGKIVVEAHFDLRERDILAPYALVKVTIEDNNPISPGYVDREDGEGEREVVSEPPDLDAT